MTTRMVTVTDGPGEYSLLIITLGRIREDPSVAKRGQTAQCRRGTNRARLPALNRVQRSLAGLLFENRAQTLEF
jgi:hypothetical protein